VPDGAFAAVAADFRRRGSRIRKIWKIAERTAGIRNQYQSELGPKNPATHIAAMKTAAAVEGLRHNGSGAPYV
jgi:hypothetical protein